VKFKDLHYQDNPLLICNIWDGMSTKIADKLGFQAIGTSSAAISNMLGYEDGENMSFSELCYFVKQIRATSPLPLTVDIESGYSREPQEIAENIISLAKLGVAGINIEDSVVNKQRTLIDAGTFAHLLAEVTALLSDMGNFLFDNMYRHLEHKLQSVVNSQSFEAIS